MGVLHAGGSGQATAPNLPLSLHADSVWQVLDLDTFVPQPQYAFAQTPPADAFVTTWTVSAGQNITINFVGSGMNVTWGDGTTETDLSGSQTHTYENADNYTVSVTGGLTGLTLDRPKDFLGPGPVPELASIDQWGGISWTNMSNAFAGASNMTYSATDTPDLSDVTDMSNMFQIATSFDGNLSSWNVSSVTDMSFMFRSASSFNQPLSSWDVSSVRDTTFMFIGASSFNQTLNDWDVSSVIYMSSMFFSATAFDGNISAWNVSSVKNMNEMFFGAEAFNQPLNDWNVSSVTNMESMFSTASSFNQPLNDWNVSAATIMDNMFDGATSFDQNLGNWYVVPDSTSIARTDVPGVVGTISAQNADLDSHNSTYSIVPSGGPTRFAIVNGNQLNMTSVDGAESDYTVNVTASGGTVFEDGNNWRVLNVTVTDVVANQPPTITGITGDDTINEGDSGTLTGTATDGDGTVSSYSWSVDDDMAVTIDTGNVATLQYTASPVSLNTTVTFTLTVTDNDEATASDTYDVTIINLVANQPPTITGITGDDTINEGDSGTLTGTATDGDGTVSSYSWSVDDDMAVTIDTGNVATLQYTASPVSLNTTVTFTLTVTDNDEATASDTYDVTIINLVANQPPTITGITGATTINESASGTLTGTATDGDGTVSSYSWSVDDDMAVTIDTGNVATLQYTASPVSLNTTVTFTLTVTDNDEATASDTYDVTIINLVANQPPTITGITGATTINESASGTLTGTATDGDGTVSSYSWSVDDDMAVTIDTGNVATLQYTASPVSLNTTVTFTLTVTDNDEATASDTYDVTVLDVPLPPGTFEAFIVPPASPTNQDPTFGVTFGSAVLAGEFTADDVATSPPSLDVSVSGSGTSFSFTITDAPDGRITAHIPAGAVSAGGDSNAASNRASITVDKTDPRITSARVSDSDGITVSFSEGVQGTTGASDWSLDGAPGVAVDSVTGLPGGSVALGLSGDLPGDRPELTLDYSGSGILDLAGNPLEADDDIAVRYPSSGRSQESSAPPVIDIGSVIKLYPQSVPEWVSQAAGARDPGTPIPSISVNGTFAFPLEISSMGYLLDGSVNTLVPHVVAAGQPVTIKVTVHDPTPIAYFAAYLNLQGNDVSHLDSDAQIIWDYGQTYVIDRSGLMRDITVTMSEDPDDPTRNTFTVTVTLSESMGKTNMAIRTWNADGQLAEVQIFDALDVRAPELEPVVVDPEPAETEPVVVDPAPAAVDDSAGRDILAIRMWSGFEPESISDAQLLASLGLDYPGADIPAWVMTETGAAGSQGRCHGRRVQDGAGVRTWECLTAARRIRA